MSESVRSAWKLLNRALGLYWVYMAIMEKKMETMGIIGDILYIGVILELNWDNGKEHGNYYSVIGLYSDYIGGILGLYRNNGKENANYYDGLYWGWWWGGGGCSGGGV